MNLKKIFHREVTVTGMNQVSKGKSGSDDDYNGKDAW